MRHEFRVFCDTRGVLPAPSRASPERPRQHGVDVLPSRARDGLVARWLAAMCHDVVDARAVHPDRERPKRPSRSSVAARSVPLALTSYACGLAGAGESSSKFRPDAGLESARSTTPRITSAPRLAGPRGGTPEMRTICVSSNVPGERA